ncbi:hypothetical protein SAMN02745121_04141 [Nannocystis exedens]|uniref:Uncharacterized protein n=2 Tax=Nannocystis exedens TaxID=54 RepID=A0A1I2AA30_9BACT|nr:hypothetical protein [Nannocystis exedens]PCC69717.1 hypothetical protein NAEX_02741 [Nannocystis exedens]SFE40577.1 hypothetical protein SAMN02745121_04141 [Nannocystis exedens]
MNPSGLPDPPPPYPRKVLPLAVLLVFVHGSITLSAVLDSSGGDGGLAAVGVFITGLFILFTALALLGAIAAFIESDVAWALLVLPTLGLVLVALGLIFYMLD